MKNLRADILELFASLDGYSRLAEVLEVYVARRRASAVEQVRIWRANNPAKARELARRSSKSYNQRHPEKRRELKRRSIERRLADPARAAVLRETWRRNSAAYRARRAAAQAESRRAA